VDITDTDRGEIPRGIAKFKARPEKSAAGFCVPEDCMTAEIIQFIPKANPERELPEFPAIMILPVVYVGSPDTSPSEMNPGKDSA
jgi:hypothetical protein